jgi:hypothetical protein
MSRCTVRVRHERYGEVRCVEESAPKQTRCLAHLGEPPDGPPFAEALAAATLRTLGGCLVWGALAERRSGAQRRSGAEVLAPGGRRPTFWHDELGLYVDLTSWLFLERFGRPRPGGSYQRCRTPGCVEPDHASEPARRRGRRVDVESRLDNHFDWGAA